MAAYRITLDYRDTLVPIVASIRSTPRQNPLGTTMDRFKFDELAPTPSVRSPSRRPISTRFSMNPPSRASIEREFEEMGLPELRESP